MYILIHTEKQANKKQGIEPPLASRRLSLQKGKMHIATRKGSTGERMVLRLVKDPEAPTQFWLGDSEST